MQINQYYEPFHYVVIDNFLPENIFNHVIDKLYSIDCEVPDIPKEYKRYSDWPSCVPIGTQAGEKDFIDFDLSKERGLVQSYINEKLTPNDPILKDNFYYSGYYEIARDSFPPHNDNAIFNLYEDKFYSGIIKGVIYLGKKDIEYKNYGTYLYDSKTFEKVTEVEFVPNRLILFDTSEDSYHGTDYHTEYPIIKIITDMLPKQPPTRLPHKRFTFNLEFGANKNLDFEYVKKLYSDINYPNSAILKQFFK